METSIYHLTVASIDRKQDSQTEALLPQYTRVDSQLSPVRPLNLASYSPYNSEIHLYVHVWMVERRRCLIIEEFPCSSIFIAISKDCLNSLSTEA